MNAKLLLPLTALFAAPLSANSASIVEAYTYTALNRAIPDGNPAGLVETRSIASAIDVITDIRVTLDISAVPTLGNLGFNGDLYVYLQHESAISILLNRVGASSGNPFGYGDNGLNVTFDDAAANDIHLYRDFVTLVPLAALTGTWQPDGRAVDPSVVLDTSARAALLSSFDGMNADGEWTLFIADLSTGSTHVLNSYSIEITGVPEPSGALLGLAGAMTLGARIRNRRRASRR